MDLYKIFASTMNPLESLITLRAFPFLRVFSMMLRETEGRNRKGIKERG